MAVTLDDFVFEDSRFDALGKVLRCSRDAAVVRMARVWKQCMEMGTDRLPPQLLAPILRCHSERVVEVLCDTSFRVPYSG